MVLEAALKDLQEELHRLRERLYELRITVREDRPKGDDIIIVDRFGDAADDLLGLLDEALTAVSAGDDAFSKSRNPDDWRVNIVLCHRRLNELTQAFWSQLASHEWLKDLTAVAQRFRAWRGWAQSVQDALELCKAPLYQSSQALVPCWEELSERFGKTSVSAHAIGQQITLPDGDERIFKGVT